jgi:hypothetical protein
MKELDQINRLGFEAWADNLIVNALEDLDGKPPFGFDIETNDATLIIRVIGDEVTATVRAYIPGKGYAYHDRTFKLKPRAE